MKHRELATALFGVIVALLGFMWFLQGAGIIQMCPMLCIMDCECIKGGSQLWEAVGAIAFIIGIIIAGISMRSHRYPLQ
jgi:hypothetical protein